MYISEKCKTFTFSIHSHNKPTIFMTEYNYATLSAVFIYLLLLSEDFVVKTLR